MEPERVQALRDTKALMTKASSTRLNIQGEKEGAPRGAAGQSTRRLRVRRAEED